MDSNLSIRQDSLPMLETERLILRNLAPQDAEALYRIYHEPDVYKYFTEEPPVSVEVERANIERHLGHYERHGYGLWATILRSSGEIIGRCGLLSHEVGDIRELHIAYLLSPRFWGQGLASEATRAIRDFAFSNIDCMRLDAVIHPENLASKRVAMAIGMAFHRTARFKDIDVEIFSITKDGASGIAKE